MLTSTSRSFLSLYRTILSAIVTNSATTMHSKNLIAIKSLLPRLTETTFSKIVPYKAWLFGFMAFLMQLSLILFICPEKSIWQSWISLASHWDSEWYEAIAKLGYINIDGPWHSGLANANVVFFPGYPYLARMLVIALNLNAKVALLLVSQTAALLFWCLIFYILRNTRWTVQLGATILIMAFPTSWFLLMGYSESLFILACCLTLWLATEKKWFLSALAGILMTSTRLIGLPALIAPLLATVCMTIYQLSPPLTYKKFTQNLCDFWPSCLIVLIGSMGCFSFFLICALYFGSWHLYFDMERIGWKGTADPWFLLKTATWLPPPFGYAVDLAPELPNAYASLFVFKFFRLAAYTFSETLVPLFLWFILLLSVLNFKRTRNLDKKSLIWFFAAVLLFLLTCFSLSTRLYESMSRCLLPIWILLIISDAVHPNPVFFFRNNHSKLFYIIMSGIIIIGFGFWLQLLNRFFIGWWVA